jgi:hypothetical protein
MDEAEAIVIDDTSDVAIAVKSQQSTLPDGWKKLPTNKKHKKNNPDAPNFYYFNTLTSETRWLPPMPLLPGQESHCQSLPVGFDAASNKGMKNYFHCAQPPTQSLGDAVNTGCDEELAVDIVVNVPPKEEEDEEEELTDLQKIQRQVRVRH